MHWMALRWIERNFSIWNQIVFIYFVVDFFFQFCLSYLSIPSLSLFHRISRQITDFLIDLHSLQATSQLTESISTTSGFDSFNEPVE